MERIDSQREVSELLVHLEGNVRWLARDVVQTILRQELKKRRPTRAQRAPEAPSRGARRINRIKMTSAAPADGERKKQKAPSKHTLTLHKAIEQCQRDTITQALAASERNVSLAARLLGLARSRLYKLMHKLGLWRAHQARPNAPRYSRVRERARPRARRRGR